MAGERDDAGFRPVERHVDRLVNRGTVGGPGRTRRPFDVELQPVLGDSIEQAVAPLHDHYGTIEVDVEVIQFDRVLQPVGVHVHEGRLPCVARMRSCENKRRARHRAANPQFRTEAARESRLACAKLAVQKHQVARSQASRYSRAQGLHVFGGSDREPGHRVNTLVTRGPMRVTIS